MTADRRLYRLVQLNAGVLLLALPTALLPFAWMDAVHREFLGLGPLSDVPLTAYMARSLSLVYAMHGVVVLGVTLNWERYRSAVPLLAKLHVAFGLAMLANDLAAGLPWWWVAAEGPGVIAYALVVLAAARRAEREREEPTS
ncbi:Signal peptide protein OS=Rhodopirellula europaea SH398 GN=RESH_04555 PE=4 SV=1 [Gemmataceae bacterium]|nr:Signal peptide protein OS=Rhodopirellula europaea SH398 GN=RESH_04555 PE=4 SV=1 [Gemmataceae bacterium]VTT99216.1 Signal peptide protein OS=Rhodopirellula europaea SH398 GN=RESH_04555 PE=4 SV=1 [Gemmataceae bacterium]